MTLGEERDGLAGSFQHPHLFQVCYRLLPVIEDFSDVLTRNPLGVPGCSDLDMGEVPPAEIVKLGSRLHTQKRYKH